MTFDLTPEQLRRAQVRGGLKRKKNLGPQFGRTKPSKPCKDISPDTPLCPQCGSSSLKKHSVNRLRCNVCGEYLLPSDAVFAAAPILPQEPIKVSGEKAARREPRPFNELHRDPFAHRKLAMLVRK